MTTLIPGSSNLQNTITPSPNPPLSPTSTSQNIQIAAAFASSPQNLNAALSTVDNLLAFEDHYENESPQHPTVETYVPTTTNCNEPIIPLSQPTRSPPIPITTNAEQNLSGIETWAQNLPSPQTYPQLNQAQTFPMRTTLLDSLPSQTSFFRTSNPPLLSIRPMFLYLLLGIKRRTLIFHIRICIQSKRHFQRAQTFFLGPRSP